MGPEKDNVCAPKIAFISLSISLNIILGAQKNRLI